MVELWLTRFSWISPYDKEYTTLESRDLAQFLIIGLVRSIGLTKGRDW